MGCGTRAGGIVRPRTCAVDRREDPLPRIMATTVTRRPSTAIGLPPIREVHAPKWFPDLPRWASTGGVLAALIAVSAVLRTRQLGGELWFSEANAIGIAHHSLGQLPGVARNGGAAPLYYVLLHFWIDVVGSSATDAHALSLLFGLVTIPVAMWVGWNIGGRRAAFAPTSQHPRRGHRADPAPDVDRRPRGSPQDRRIPDLAPRG